MSRVVAVCGKGGVGKTTVSALATRSLARQHGGKVLVVDADHAGGLGLALGLQPSTTLEQLRRATQDEAREQGLTRAELQASVDFQLLAAVAERGSVAFLSLGRPVGRGCYCSINKLLRESLAQLAGEFDLVWIDAEAGVEQINRDVLGAIDQLLLVSDPTAKGVRVAEVIREVAADLDRLRDVHLLVNRVRSPRDLDAVWERTELPIIGAIPEDELVRDFDAAERSMLEMPGEAPALRAVQGALEILL